MQVSVDIGSFVVDDTCPQFHVCYDLGRDCAESRRELLQGLGISEEIAKGGDAFVFEVQEGHEEEVKKALADVLDNEDYEGLLSEPLKFLKLQMECKYSYLTSEGKVIVATKPAQTLLDKTE